MFRLRHHLPERRRHGREQGQVLVIFALAMVVILAMAGLLIDSGLTWGNRRQAQTAADTAALNAVKAYAALPVGTPTATRATAAIAAAGSMSARNGFPTGTVCCPGGTPFQGVVVNNPPVSGSHVGDPLYIEVISTRAMRTTFSGVVGQSCWLVSSRAVARLTQITTPTPGTPYPAPGFRS